MSGAFFKIIQALQNYSTELLIIKKVDENKMLEMKQKTEMKLKELIKLKDFRTAKPPQT